MITRSVKAFIAVSYVVLAAMILWAVGDTFLYLGRLDGWIECHTTVAGSPR